MKTRNERERNLYRAVEEVRQGGGSVRVAMGAWHPEKEVFALELPAAGDGAWEPLLWRTIRSVAYRQYLDQAIHLPDSERQVTISIRLRPAKRPLP